MHQDDLNSMLFTCVLFVPMFVYFPHVQQQMTYSSHLDASLLVCHLSQCLVHQDSTADSEIQYCMMHRTDLYTKSNFPTLDTGLHKLCIS